MVTMMTTLHIALRDARRFIEDIGSCPECILDEADEHEEHCQLGAILCAGDDDWIMRRINALRELLKEQENT